MRQTLNVVLLAGLMALCLVKAAASPLAGTWEGSLDGVKAATLKVQEIDGILGGSVIFYITRDEGSGKHNGAATPAVPMVGTQWDGRTLKFSVTAGDKSIPFEFRVTGEGKGELKRMANRGDAELAIPMLRAR